MRDPEPTVDRPLLIGADIGGTSTRMALADRNGRILSVVRGGPGNPKSAGEAGVREIRSVLHRCLAQAGVEPSSVSSLVLGMAGSSSISDADAFWRDALPEVDVARIRMLPDFVTAFHTGSAVPEGYLVLSGTGAAVVEVSGARMVQRHDGWGWLLGDDGSGFWLGREAVRATLRQLQSGEPLGPLARDVLSRTGAHDLASLLGAVYDRRPARLADLAPAVSAHADTDPQAARISTAAARALFDGLLGLDPRPGLPVVLTGSVLTTDGPVRTALLGLLRERVDAPVADAVSGLAGAIWLGLGELDGPGASVPGARSHADLVAAIDAATAASS